MLYGTALIKHCALAGFVPTPAVIPAVAQTTNPEDAFMAEILLVRQCAEHGREAAQENTDDIMTRLCIWIAEDCDLIAEMEVDGEFPAEFGRSPVFESFAATREKHLG